MFSGNSYISWIEWVVAKLLDVLRYTNQCELTGIIDRDEWPLPGNGFCGWESNWSNSKFSVLRYVWFKVFKIGTSISLLLGTVGFLSWTQWMVTFQHSVHRIKVNCIENGQYLLITKSRVGLVWFWVTELLVSIFSRPEVLRLFDIIDEKWEKKRYKHYNSGSIRWDKSYTTIKSKISFVMHQIDHNILYHWKWRHWLISWQIRLCLPSLVTKFINSGIFLSIHAFIIGLFFP